MSEPIDDGGPAFPCPATGRESGDTSLAKRAWFAGMALNEQEFQMLRDQYFAAHPKEATVSLQTLRVFNADSMLAELAKGRP